MFTRYREAEAKTGALLKMDWSAMRGGFLNVSNRNCTFCHRFSMRGSPLLGTQEQFMLRIQTALDNETRFSCLTLELANLFEARWIYFVIKVWPGKNFRFVFNLGWTLTNESRRYIQNQMIEHERRGLKEMRKRELEIKNNGGVINAVPR